MHESKLPTHHTICLIYCFRTATFTNSSKMTCSRTHCCYWQKQTILTNSLNKIWFEIRPAINPFQILICVACLSWLHCIQFQVRPVILMSLWVYSALQSYHSEAVYYDCANSALIITTELTSSFLRTKIILDASFPQTSCEGHMSSKNIKKWM